MLKLVIRRLGLMSRKLYYVDRERRIRDYWGKKRVNVGMIISTKIVEKSCVRNDRATAFLCASTYVMLWELCLVRYCSGRKIIQRFYSRGEWEEGDPARAFYNSEAEMLIATYLCAAWYVKTRCNNLKRINSTWRTRYISRKRNCSLKTVR